MPKKKRPRKPVRHSDSRAAEPATPEGEPILAHSPARSLVMVTDEGRADPELVEVLTTWPYAMLKADNTGPTITLGQVAADAGKDLLTTARSLVALEDANLLLWQPAAGAYWMLVPEGTPDSA